MVHSKFEDRARKRSIWPAAVALAALLGALGTLGVSAAPPAATDASGVTHWNRLAATTLVAIPGPNGGAPPAFQINMGMVQGAVYDAVNAIGPKQHQPYLLDRRAGAKASVDAAVATAAYDVLSELVSTAPERAPFPGRAGLLSTLSTEHAASLGAIADNASKRQGVEIGHAAAAAMLDAREDDGRFGPSAWVPNTAAGHWWPLLNAMGQQILDPTPWAGDVEPFFIQSSSQFRSAPPPALDSQQWADEFNEVKSYRQGDWLDPDRRPDVHRQVVAECTRPELERGRTPAHHTNRSRRRRQREAPRPAEPERGGRGDQLLERQVPLRLLAAVERDPTSGRGRPCRHGTRRHLDRAPHGAVSRVGLGTQLPRRRTRRRAAGVLRRRPGGRALPDHEHVRRIPAGPLCASSRRSRSRSRSSSKRGSGPASTTAAATWRASGSGGTSPHMGLPTISSLWATDHPQR